MHRFGLNRTFKAYWMPAFAGMTPERGHPQFLNGLLRKREPRRP